jgi:hypothetical protein
MRFDLRPTVRFDLLHLDHYRVNVKRNIEISATETQIKTAPQNRGTFALE